jgi:predicted nucleic acid-binding protein
MILLDACVLLNLCATDRLEEIGQAVGGGFSICTEVRKEALFLRDPNDATQPLKPLVLDPLFDRGILTPLSLAADEEPLFVNIAAELDEGEAMSMAIALHRNLALATDDRKAIRVYATNGGDPAKLWTTPALVKTWADARSPAQAELARITSAVRDRARYVPPGNHPLHAWWTQWV